MSREQTRAGFGLARLKRVGAALLHAAIAPTVSLAFAVTGAAAALHFAAPPRSGEYLPRPARTAASLEKPVVMAALPPSTGPERIAAGAENASNRSAAGPAASPPTAASRIPEHELTFAWGYAQRHPGAAARKAEARVAALATARRQKAESGSKRPPRDQPEPRGASPAQRAIAGLAASRFPASADSDPHQALGYTEQRYANGLHVFSYGQSAPGPHQRKPSPRHT